MTHNSAQREFKARQWGMEELGRGFSQASPEEQFVVGLEITDNRQKMQFLRVKMRVPEKRVVAGA